MIEQPIEQLRASDPSDRRNALEALYDYACDDRVLEAAVYLLADQDRGVREAASHVLVLCSSDKAAVLTATHISSSNIAVRNLAGDALVKMKGPAVTALLPYVDSDDKDVRKFAIDLIAQLPTNPVAIAKVAARLHDSDPNVVCAAVDAIGSVHADQYLGQLIELYNQSEFARPNIINATAKLQGQETLHFFLKALSDEDPVVQLAAAEAISTRKDEGILDVLLEKLDRVSGLARPVILHSIIVLLESCDNSVDIPSQLRRNLIEMLDDSDPVYMRAAVRGLKFFIDDEVLSLLVSHVGENATVNDTIFAILRDYPEKALRQALAHAGKAEDITAVAGLIISLVHLVSDDGDNSDDAAQILDETTAFVAEYFGQFDVDTKIAALSTFGSIAAPSAIKVIKAGLDDPEPAIKGCALDFVTRLGPRHFKQELEVLTGDYDEEIRFAASSLMTQLNPDYQN